MFDKTKPLKENTNQKEKWYTIMRVRFKKILNNKKVGYETMGEKWNQVHTWYFLIHHTFLMKNIKIYEWYKTEFFSVG